MNPSDDTAATSAYPGPSAPLDAAVSWYPAWGQPQPRSRGRRRLLTVLVLLLVALSVPVAWSWTRVVQQVVPSSRAEMADDLTRLQHGLDTQVFDPLQQTLRG